jgi:hypothetical protein
METNRASSGSNGTGPTIDMRCWQRSSPRADAVVSALVLIAVVWLVIGMPTSGRLAELLIAVLLAVTGSDLARPQLQKMVYLKKTVCLLFGT